MTGISIVDLSLQRFLFALPYNGRLWKILSTLFYPNLVSALLMAVPTLGVYGLATKTPSPFLNRLLQQEFCGNFSELLYAVENFNLHSIDYYTVPFNRHSSTFMN